MTDHASPAAEIRAHLTTWSKRAAEARQATMTGHDEREWFPWYGVAHRVPDHDAPPVTPDTVFGLMTGPPIKDTGQALVAHHRYGHDHDEDWYEADFIAGPLDARLAAWIILTGPDLADPTVALLALLADAMEAHNATEQHVAPFPDAPRHGRVVMDGHKQIRLDWTAALALARRLAEPAAVPLTPPVCNGACTTAADLGADEYGDLIAYAHPTCPFHA
ncbi:hypothetical protein ACWDRB_47310 [Nonomuraea sp. NPDC003707]